MAIKISGQGAPILLLHSSLSSHRQWSALAAKLVATGRFCVISADLMGYGDEPCPQAPRPFSLADEVQCLLERLPDEIRRQPFCVVGHSYGGAVALQLALSKALDVRQLALFEPVAFHLLKAEPTLWHEVTALADELPKLSSAQAAERFIDYWQTAGYFAALPTKLQQGLAAQVGKVTLDFEGLAGAPWTLHDYQHRLPMPVWLGSGLQSRQSAQRIVQLLAGVLPAVQCMNFHCGHMGPVADAEPINQALLQFLTSRLSSGSD